MLDVLYLDNHRLVLKKPAGMLVQGDSTGDESLLQRARDYIKNEFNKPGNVFLGLVHSLDRPASGIVVFARTSKAASRLSEQFRIRKVKKIYWALVQGKTENAGQFVDRIVRHNNWSQVSKDDKGQEARVSFRRPGYSDDISWVEIELGTGRHHQIRVQFAHRGHPILGDLRYGFKINFYKKALALHAYSITIIHPTRRKKLIFTAEPESYWEKYLFANNRQA